VLGAKIRGARYGFVTGRGAAAGAAVRCARDSWRPGQRRAAVASHEFSWLGRPRGCDVVDANLAESGARKGGHGPTTTSPARFSSLFLRPFSAQQEERKPSLLGGPTGHRPAASACCCSRAVWLVSVRAHLSVSLSAYAWISGTGRQGPGCVRPTFGSGLAQVQKPWFG